jgi:hypothetical protein
MAGFEVIIETGTSFLVTQPYLSYRGWLLRA